MKPFKLFKFIGLHGLLAILLLVPACQPELPLLDRIQQTGELVVATRVGPTTYYTELDQPTGFEYELAQKFADYLGVQLKLVTYDDLGELFNALARGEVHLAAAGLTITRERSRQFQFTSPYQQVTQQVVYKAGNSYPADVTELNNGTMVVIANSSHSENLALLKDEQPELTWEEKASSSMLNMLTLVDEGKADYTIVDSNVFALHQDIFPELRAAFDISTAEPLAWALPQNEDHSLFYAAEYFFNRIQEDGSLEDLRERFYGHREFDYVGARTFIRHMEARLPKYQESFKEIADEIQLDWRLLAAISYQESLWNPNAISPTGVRGLMMLTRRTAKEMGVGNRTNPSQSIRGGAEYFRKLYDRLPDTITEPHRTWFALAAYNAGYGHLLDARTLTTMQGGNPDNWFDVRERLPLLRKREFYSKVKYGYARGGGQSVHYVRNIRKYYDSLVWSTENESDKYVHLPQSVVAMRNELVH